VTDSITKDFSPTFFLAPKNSELLFFTSNATSIFVLDDRTRTISTVVGRLAEFLETSTCDSDCTFNGNCIGNKCSCFENYYGSVCDTFCFANTTCSGHGTCASNGSCLCNSFWTGPKCDKLVLNPPTFPPVLSVYSVKHGNSVYNYFYDFPGQRRKFEYISGNNVTDLYNVGYSYTVFPNLTCVSVALTEIRLDVWRVDPAASLQNYNVPCDNDVCSLWTFSSGGKDIHWLVNSHNLPLQISIANDMYVYDPKKFILGNPDPSVWKIPSNC